MSRLTSYIITTVYWMLTLASVAVGTAFFVDCKRLRLTDAQCSTRQGWAMGLGCAVCVGLYLLLRRWLKRQRARHTPARPEPPPYLFATALYWSFAPLLITITVFSLTRAVGEVLAIWFAFAVVVLIYAGLLVRLGGGHPVSQPSAETKRRLENSRTLASVVFACAAFYGLVPATFMIGHCFPRTSACVATGQQGLLAALAAAGAGYTVLLWRFRYRRE